MGKVDFFWTKDVIQLNPGKYPFGNCGKTCFDTFRREQKSVFFSTRSKTPQNNSGNQKYTKADLKNILVRVRDKFIKIRRLGFCISSLPIRFEISETHYINLDLSLTPCLIKKPKISSIKFKCVRSVVHQ